MQPYRDSDEQRVDEFYGLLSTYPNLDWIAPNLEIADLERFSKWCRNRPDSLVLCFKFPKTHQSDLLAVDCSDALSDSGGRVQNPGKLIRTV